MAADGPLHKIGERFRGRNLFRHAVNNHLAFQDQPRKEQRDLRIFADLAGFSAFQVGEKNKSARVVTLEQDRAQRRPRAGGSGRQAHRIRIDHAGAAGLFKPERKLLHRVGLQIFPPQFSASVLAP